MRLRPLAGIAAVALSTAGVASAAVPVAALRVSPRGGGPSTVFTVAFRSPDKTGASGGMRRSYELSVAASGGTDTSGCLPGLSISLPAGARGSARAVRLDPRRVGSIWCQGTYRGVIEEIAAPVCAKGRACPAFVRLVGTIGHFSFSVTARSGGDRVPPTFAGIQTAFACTPGAQRPGQTTPFTLTWHAASDNVTSAAQIVYDVYVASSPGVESFARPTWTTPPGVTSYRTGGLASHGSFYFVVRARDAAGNEDANTVEVHGVDPCL